MKQLRTAALAALVVCAVSLGAAGTASAAQQSAATPLTQKVQLTGTKGFKGTFAIDRFATKNGKLVALGKLSGTVRKNGKTKRVKARSVTLPASVAGAGPSSAANAAQLPPLPGGRSCQVLSLDLGPINLNVLGLVVRTNQIQLRIDAVQGPGNLLGNLLCGITGILNPAGALANTPLGQLAQILNALLALSPRTA
jgi:hypothetical protein